MPVNRKPIFDAVKQLRGGKAWDQASVDILDRGIDQGTGERTSRLYPAEPVVVSPRPASPPPPALGFKLGQTSKQKLLYLMPSLRNCVELAIGYTSVDFGVTQTVRTIEQQKQAVATGHSRTMHSRHLKQADGWSHAVDLVAYVDGKISWDFSLYGAIALAMDTAATKLGIAGHVRWGCAWDRVLSDFEGDAKSYLEEARKYAARHPGSDLLDAPHFEWVP